METIIKHIDTKKQLVPKLRFKEFDELWGKFELKDLTQRITVGIATEVRPFVSDKKEVPLLRNQNIKIGYFDNTNMEYITHEFDLSNKSKRVKSGDVIIVRTGSNMGNACVVPEEYENSQTFTTLIVRPLVNKLSSQFLSFHINSFGLSEVERLSAGGGKPNLNAGFLKEYRIKVCSYPEQQKIASFLSAVDEKIQLLTRKKELLENYKKGAMQQLFSQKLRFKDDTSTGLSAGNGKNFPDWEEKKLDSICRFFSGGTPSSTNKNFYNGTIPFIGSGNIYDSEVTNFISEEAMKNSSAKIVQRGDLLYALYGANSGECSLSKLEGAINQAILCIRTSESLKFLYYLLSFEKENIVSKYIQGGQGNLSAQIIKNLKYKFPTLSEQQKIASFLSAIDEKIEAVNQQITQSQTFKKGLLQQMFV